MKNENLDDHKGTNYKTQSVKDIKDVKLARKVTYQDKVLCKVESLISYQNHHHHLNRIIIQKQNSLLRVYSSTQRT